jgi:DNA-binding IclR family transcriptional regulator
MLLLEALVEHRQPVGVSELARALNLDKSRAYRLLLTLKANGYLEQDPETRKYMVGPKLVILSSRILGNNDLYVQARPVMKEVRKGTGETVHLAVRMEDQAVYIAQEISPEVIGVNTEVGQREPLYCTAVGKALVAFLPEAELEALVQQLEFRPHTPRTITSPAQFKAHCWEIRARGYAVDDEELHPGVRCIGAPIRGHDGSVVASLGISGPASRLRLEVIPRLARLVVAGANKISYRLGYLEARSP